MHTFLRSSVCLAAAIYMSGQMAFAASTGRIEVEPRSVWTFDSGSPIYGDSAVIADTVYTANTGGQIYALDSQTGDMLWQYVADGPVYGGVGEGEEGVYVLSDDGFTYKLNPATGALLWRAETPNTLPRSPLLANDSNWDYRGATPIEKDGVVYVGSGNGVFYALNAADGSVLWEYQTDGAIRVDAAVTDDYAIVGTLSGTLYCFDRRTGEPAWQYDIRTGLGDAPLYHSINSPASVFNDTVYVGTRNTYLYALDLQSGAVKWTYFYQSSWAESPISYFDGTIYVGSSFLRAQLAFDAEDGSLLWRHGRTRGLSYAGLVPTEDGLYTGTVAVPGLQFEGFLTDGGLLKLDRLSGETKWFYALDENPHLTEFGVISTPVLADGRIYFGSLDGVYHAVEEIIHEFPILEFSVDRAELKPGEKTWLRWEVIDGHSVRLNGRKVPKRGKRLIRGFDDTTYTLTVKGRLDETQSIPVEVKSASEINVAKYGSAEATSTEDSQQYSAAMAIDGDLQTRWASQFADGESITVDLGKKFDLDRVIINWEGAFASAYRIEVSNNGSDWQLAANVSESDGGLDEITGLTVSGRYLRLTGDVRGTPYGVSIYELEVYEREDERRCRNKKRHWH